MRLFSRQKLVSRKAATRQAAMRALVRSISLPLLLAATVANSAYGLEENRLWLPRAQHELRPLLVQAAQLAENAEGCQEVISGELDTERSVDAAPVFRIVCRNPAGYTYSVFVTDAGKPNASVEKVQSADSASVGKTATPSGNPARPATVDDNTANRKCLAALKLRTDRMVDVVLQESDLRRRQAPTGDVQYELDFDAADPSGLALRFHAICRVSAGGTALIEIKPRRADAAVSHKPDVPAAQQEAGDKNSVLTDEATAADGRMPAPANESEKAQKPKLAQPAAPKPVAPKVTDDDGWEVVE